MTDQDDDLWNTYIASTPEEDAEFAGCVKPMAWIILAVIAAGLLLWAAS